MHDLLSDPKQYYSKTKLKNSLDNYKIENSFFFVFLKRKIILLIQINNILIDKLIFEIIIVTKISII